MKRPISLMLAFLLFLTVLEAETFRFRFSPGEKYRVVTTVEEKVLVNGGLRNYVDILNKIAVEILDVKDGTGAFSSLYQYSEKLFNEAGSFVLQDESSSAFTLDPQGRHDVDERYLFPLTRSIPFFPEGDIKPGFTWSAPGEEVHDLRRPYGIAKPYKFPVTVQYLYLGDAVINKVRVAQFKIRYSFFHKVENIDPKSGRYIPERITGDIEMTYNWDPLSGKVHSYTEHFDILYLLANGETFEFIGVARGEVVQAAILEKTKTAENITEDIKKEKLEGVRVEATKEGVKIVLENIEFEADSAVIQAKEKLKLESIARILGRYPDRDVRIVGHTAGLGTEEYLRNLSQRRAKAVGDHLLALEVKKASQMTIIGKGASEPLADNGTEEGRKKNRRVEIIILEN